VRYSVQHVNAKAYTVSEGSHAWAFEARLTAGESRESLERMERVWLIAACGVLFGCGTDPVAGTSSALDAAVDCAVAPVYHPVFPDGGCVGAWPPCDYCPRAEAAYLARASELGCCAPFRCGWRPYTTPASAEAQLAEAATCTDLVARGRNLLPGPGEAWPAGSAEWTPADAGP
jgi:hypothetical protein